MDASGLPKYWKTVSRAEPKGGVPVRSAPSGQPENDEGERALFRALFEETGIGTAFLGLSGRLLRANHSLCTMIGSVEETLRGQPFLSRGLPGDETVELQLAQLIRGDVNNFRFVRDLPLDNRKTLRVRIIVTAVRDRAGRPQMLAAVVEDATAEKSAFDALCTAEAKYRSIFENAVEGIFLTSVEGCIEEANPSLARILGYETPSELIATVDDVSRQIYVDPERRAEMIRLLKERGALTGFVSAVRRKDGSVIWVNENVRAIQGKQGEILRFEGSVEDITDRKRVEEQLLHDALHDSLTTLPNRALFLDRLAHAINRAHRRSQFRFAILYIDCDRFKLVNDGLGHLFGDLLLRELSNRLAECLRGADTLARMGGDEFAILAEDLESPDDAKRLADRIQTALSRPFRIDNQELYVSVSVGIAMGGPTYSEAAEMLRDADVAMFEAKGEGRGHIVTFETGMAVAAASKLRVENDLRKALERGEFRVHYQPIIDLNNSHLIGFEALIRWEHPERGLVLPGTFIPTAEDNGMIKSIGEWVLEESCRQVRSWQDLKPGKANDVILNVNVSPAQLREPDIVERVRNILDRTGFNPSNLKLEITESAIIENPIAAKATLNALKSLGIKLSIDDFGTGFSSLSHLYNFPIDTIKIDRSFVAPMDREGARSEIVRSILMLGSNLGKNVIAEGIETLNHARNLKAMGCNAGQGYLFSRPVAADVAFKYVANDE